MVQLRSFAFVQNLAKKSIFFNRPLYALTLSESFSSEDDGQSSSKKKKKSKSDDKEVGGPRQAKLQKLYDYLAQTQKVTYRKGLLPKKTPEVKKRNAAIGAKWNSFMARHNAILNNDLSTKNFLRNEAIKALPENLVKQLDEFYDSVEYDAEEVKPTREYPIWVTAPVKAFDDKAILDLNKQAEGEEAAAKEEEDREINELESASKK